MGRNKVPAIHSWQTVCFTNRSPALAYINKTKYQNDHTMRWVLALQGYEYTVQDISGKDNVAADYLSRMMN